jgi:hypothetical protein
MSAPLKPCPFCGESHLSEQVGSGYDRVTCDTCDIVKIPASSWNRRTPDRAALVEVARRAIADCRNCDDPACEACTSEASGVVAEYLAEQAGKETQ